MKLRRNKNKTQNSLISGSGLCPALRAVVEKVQKKIEPQTAKNSTAK